MATGVNHARVIPGTAQLQRAVLIKRLFALGLVAVALLVTLANDAGQLVFAAGVILVLGLPHGASDHLVACPSTDVRHPGRWIAFLGIYVGTVALTIAAWRLAPGPALLAFLLLSATHFALDDLPGETWAKRWPERIARGLMPVTLPAAFHRDELAGLFAVLSTPDWGAALALAAACLAPLVLVLVCFALAGRYSDGPLDAKAWELCAVATGLLAFPPLVGFALYFALVHSRGQTQERMQRLRIESLAQYLRATSPTLAGALTLFGGLVVLAWGGQAPAIGPLFIGLSALTVPHMLVTPWFADHLAP